MLKQMISKINQENEAKVIESARNNPEEAN